MIRRPPRSTPLYSSAASVVYNRQVSGISEPRPGMTLDAKGRLRTRLLQVVARQNGEWKVVAYHNVDVKPGIPVPDPM
jgi:hypothetical protein